MKTEQRIYSETTGWLKKSENTLGNLAQLVFLFGNKDLLKEQQHIDFISNEYPAAQIVGCSTSGEIYQEEVYDNNIVCTAVWFENTQIDIAKEHVLTMEDSYIVGEKLAEKLDKEHLVHIMKIGRAHV